MSEHDEPKTALTRLVVDTLAALGSPHEVARQVTRQHDGMHANSSVCIGCGETFPADGPSWPDAARGHDRHQWQAIAAHLADVLLAEGYTTSPAPETTEREARLAAENERLRNTLADVRAAHTQARAALLQHQTSTTSTGDRP